MQLAGRSIERNIHSQVAGRIAIRIVGGEFAPGDALPSETELCSIFGVSRTVVREATRTLAGKGLLEARTKSGTRVRPLQFWNHLDADVLRWRLRTSDPESCLKKLLQLRDTVEPLVSELAASAATDTDVAKIRECYDILAVTNNADAFNGADIAFHQAVYSATHNEFLWPIAQIFEYALTHQSRTFSQAEWTAHRERALTDYRALLQAIDGRDPDGARAATVAMLKRSTADFLSVQEAATRRLVEPPQVP
jgi:DNA-binding FadR family transcriptional regulator